MTNDDGRAALLQHLVRTDYRSVRVTAGSVSFRSLAGSAPVAAPAALVSAPAEVAVVAPTPGWATLEVSEGDLVEEGQVLARLRTSSGERAVAAPCAARVVVSGITDDEFVGYGTELVRLAPNA